MTSLINKDQNSEAVLTLLTSYVQMLNENICCTSCEWFKFWLNDHSPVIDH